ncbi:polyketide cyclase [Williamsia sp. D3]|uniref:polyketide cyclase n=1 Tax=Williamsia sp. D3 TaxID=1313067 RepID=UPI0003D3296D|nr:polyketide cyclase [Williamsia sp. D3]ETD32721.1 polyketide cyclase [Williamsia sp. D3]
MNERLQAERVIPAHVDDIFAVLTDPQGHVAIDASGMLMSATGERVTASGDTFVVHMDREALGDVPMGEYDVSVIIETFEPGRQISWTIKGRLRPQIGHIYGYELHPDGESGTRVVSFYDWSNIHPDWRAKGIFPVISATALRSTLGILDRTVRRGYPLASPK